MNRRERAAGKIARDSEKRTEEEEEGGGEGSDFTLISTDYA